MPLPPPRTPRAQRALVVVLVLSLCVAGTALSACGGSAAPAAPSANQGAIVNEPTPNRVALINQEGQPVTLGGLKGKVVVLAPFLSLCQDECPLITAAFIGLQRDLRAAGLGDKVVFVEASVDPGRDTARPPGRLSKGIRGRLGPVDR